MALQGKYFHIEYLEKRNKSESKLGIVTDIHTMHAAYLKIHGLSFPVMIHPTTQKKLICSFNNSCMKSSSVPYREQRMEKKTA